jgi:hypothetical protein
MADLTIKLRADATQAQRVVASFGAELTKRIAGAFAAGAVIDRIAAFVQSVRESVDEIKDLSDQLGLSTEQVQRLQKAANDAGVKFNVITTALQKIEAMRAQAQSGDNGAMGIFQALGIDPNQGSALDILKQAVDGTRNSAAVVDLVGNKARILSNIVAEMNVQGPITLISDDEIKKLDDVNARWEELVRKSKALATGPLSLVVDLSERYFTAMGEQFVGTINLAASAFSDKISSKAALSRIGNAAVIMYGTDEQRRKLALEKQLSTPLPSDLFVGPVQEAPAFKSTVATQTARASIPLGQPGDALSRIGLFVGGRPESSILAGIERNTHDTARASRDVVKGLADVAQAVRDAF